MLTALSVAAGGNVTGGLGQLAQNATVAYLQELGANQVKQIADSLGSEEARAALHAIVGCAGAAASSQSCGAGAMSAATSSVLGSLLAPSTNLSASEREARDIPDQVKNLVDYVFTMAGGEGGNSSFWSSAKDKSPVENAYGHSIKHGGEFPDYQNAVQYVQAAQDFVNNPPAGTLTKTRPNGDTLYYDPVTNTFASKNKDGAPKTMFRPTAGMEYWNSNDDKKGKSLTVPMLRESDHRCTRRLRNLPRMRLGGRSSAIRRSDIRRRR